VSIIDIFPSKLNKTEYLSYEYIAQMRDRDEGKKFYREGKNNYIFSGGQETEVTLGKTYMNAGHLRPESGKNQLSLKKWKYRLFRDRKTVNDALYERFFFLEFILRTTYLCRIKTAGLVLIGNSDQHDPDRCFVHAAGRIQYPGIFSFDISLDRFVVKNEVFLQRKIFQIFSYGTWRRGIPHSYATNRFRIFDLEDHFVFRMRYGYPVTESLNLKIKRGMLKSLNALATTNTG